MQTLNQWAARWQLPPQCLAELRQLLGAGEPSVRPHPQAPGSEAAVQQFRTLEAARRGGRMWRNNSGACVDDTGRLIRYGLGNVSKEVNKVMKSSDLIGITPHVAQPEDVGRLFGIFTAEECKPVGWKLTPGDTRGAAQLNFINLVVSLGGIGRFISSMEE